ncbi:MAG: ankyrin repeat domain-containing protein [Aureliella sp.]
MLNDSATQLADAILNGDAKRAFAILDKRPELATAVLLHPSTTDDTPAIILAASCGHVEIVQHLIDIGVAPETTYEKEGWSTLHIAAQRNHIHVARVLLEAGASVDPEDKRKAKPLQWALRHKHIELAELLIQHGASIDVRWRDGYAFINHEAKDGKNDTLRFMLDHGADPNTRDHRYGSGTTPLHCAARHDRLNAATILLEFGANVNARTEDGITPLDMTKYSRKQKVAQLLMSNGGKLGS